MYVLNNPAVSAVFLIKSIVLLVWLGCIGTVYQTARGRLTIDYDQRAFDAWKNEVHNKKKYFKN